MNMKKIFTYILTCTILCSANAADENAGMKELSSKFTKLEKFVSNQQNVNEQLRRENTMLRRKYEAQQTTIDSINKELTNISNDVDSKSKELNKNIEDNKQSLNVMGQDLAGKTYWGVGLLVLLAAITAVVYWLLSKRTKDNTDSVTTLRAAQEKLQEEAVKVDQRLIDILNKQIESDNASKQNVHDTASEPDHSLVLKISTEIAKLQNNIAKMDPSVRGHKQLKQSLDRMINNMKAKGYEIINLIGQDYNEGMPFEVRFIPDETLPEGKRIISGVDQLQVNYNGKMIQHAKIVVRQNITD